MNRFRNVEHLETIFIEKLTEKFKLNERDLKRAFMRFDSDKNGLIDIDELREAVKCYVAGAPNDQVDELMQAYDRSGDYKISYEELLHALETRSATKKYMKKTLQDKISAPVGREKQVDSKPKVDVKRPSNPVSFPEAKAHANEYNTARSNDRAFTRIREDFDDEDVVDDDTFDKEPARFGKVGGTAAGISRNSRAGAGEGFNIITNFNSNDHDDEDSDKMSEVETQFDENLIENQVKSYLKQMKLYLSNSAKRLAYTGRGGGNSKDDVQYNNVFGIAAESSNPVTKTERMTNTHASLISKVSRDMLLKTFEPFIGPPPFSKHLPLVNFSQFSKALRSLVIPGIANLKTNMLEFLFDLVIEYSKNPMYSLNSIFRDNESERDNGVSVVDVRIVLDVLLGDGKDKPSYVEHCAEGRSLVGQGPIRKPTATEANESKINLHVTALSGQAKPPPPMSVKVAAPLRFVSRRSRSCLSVPTGYDEEVWMKRSSRYPDFTLARDHVFGMSSSLQSGNSFFLVPPSVAAAAGVPRGRVNSSADNSTIIYPSAAVTVVHDLGSNKQFYMDGHTDDITAFTCSILSSSSILIATGSCGKYPDLQLWRYDTSNNTSLQIGVAKSKLFSRSVTMIMISSDCNYMFAIGGDDHHTIFAFSLRTLLDYVAGGCIGDIIEVSPILETPCQSGIPPMISQFAYCPYFDYCDYIDRDHAGVCDVFCTVGERHLRIWSFKRPDSASGGKASLKFRSPAPGKVSENLAPKTYTCCVFVSPSSNPSATRASENAMGDSSTGIASCDVVAGGSNGAVFLYRKGAFVTHNKIIKGGVSHIAVMGDKFVVGGSKCVVKIVDAKTLAITKTFDGYASYGTLVGSVLSNLSLSSGNYASSAAGGSSSAAVAIRPARPSSASNAPRATIATVGRGNQDKLHLNLDGINDSRSVTSSNSSRTPNSNRPGSAMSSSRKPGPSSVASNAVSTSSSSSRNKGSPSSQLSNSTPDLDDIETVTITGLAVVPGASRSTGSASAIITLSTGVAFKMDLSTDSSANGSSGIGAMRANRQIWTASEKSNNPLLTSVRPLFYYHTKDISGVATDNNRSASSIANSPQQGGYVSSISSRVAATTGDDRRLCLWNMSNKSLLCRTILEAAGKCCFFDRSNCFLAVGCSSGAFYIYAIAPNNGSKEFPVCLAQKAFRKDSQEDINDIKISPNNTGLVAGSRDNHIYVYTISLQNPGLAIASATITPVIKLSGHTSFIRQMDYSSDGKLLLSTCGAHELLCWQLPTPESPAGGLAMGINISDINWKTSHCIFGFPIMGIWPTSSSNKKIPYDGTDINGVDVCKEMGVVVVADDFGKVSLLNYPCIIENAPSRVFTGHSSHVSGIRIAQGYDKAISIGGHDCSAVMWRFEELLEEKQGLRRSAYNNRL